MRPGRKRLALVLWLVVATFQLETEISSVAAQPSATHVDESVRVPVPQPTEKALSYYRTGNLLWFANLAWGLAIPVLFLSTGLSAALRNWASRIGRKWFFVIGIYLLLFAAINFVVDLPLSYYQEYVREHAYGLSNQTFAKWFGDSVKGLMVESIAGVLFLWVPYLLLRKSPRRWWLYTSILSVPLLIFVMLVSPVWVAPLFNKFGPMKNKALEGRILALAERAGIDGGRVYEVEKSVDTKAVNAYVTGLGSTKRIVLWDTLLAKLGEREVLVVVGHEMGHYVLGHVRNGILFGCLLILVTLYLAYRLAHGLIGTYKTRWGFDRLDDIASLPLLMLLTGVFSFVVSPLAMGFSRYQEHESDRFALEITRANRSAAMTFVKLQEENLGVPYPGTLYKLLRASHPPIGERIDFCNEYRPWETGAPLRYDRVLKK